MRILGITGSVRAGSYNRRLLETAAALLPEGDELVRFEGLKRVPAYDADDDGDAPPGAVAELREAIAGADALLIATPEYNSSIPGLLKNALDWASRPFPDNALRGKPAAVIGASTGRFGAVWAQAEARKVLGSAGARAIDGELPVARAEEAFSPDGSLRDEGLTDRLRSLLDSVRVEVERDRAVRRAKPATASA